MSDLNQLWKETPAAEKTTREPVPEGTYTAYVDKVSYDETKTPHRVSIWWKIVDSDQKNRLVFANYNLSAQGIKFLKKDLDTMGIVVLEFSALMDHMESMVGHYAEIYVGHRQHEGKTYVSVFVNKKIAKNDLPEFDAEESVPF